jgi:hypothetical protein
VGYESGGREFDPRTVNITFMVDKITLRLVLPPSTSVFPVNIIPPMLHTLLRLHVARTRRTKVEAWNLLENRVVSLIRENWIEKQALGDPEG